MGSLVDSWPGRVASGETRRRLMSAWEAVASEGLAVLDAYFSNDDNADSVLRVVVSLSGGVTASICPIRVGGLAGTDWREDIPYLDVWAQEAAALGRNKMFAAPCRRLTSQSTIMCVADLGAMQRWEMSEEDAKSLVENASTEAGNNYREHGGGTQAL